MNSRSNASYNHISTTSQLNQDDFDKGTDRLLPNQRSHHIIITLIAHKQIGIFTTIIIVKPLLVC
jgi:hypothetical protein